ncbi:peptidoglycan-binding protein, partial [Candidatus Gracilibacteria bacterium]|nr:peptidoglycan-binding protein [Candidatus Gracilibacteria bacterium]
FNNITNPIVLNDGEYTEIEYLIRSTADIIPDIPYCFRVTNNGDASDFTYTNTPQVTSRNISYRRQGGGPVIVVPAWQQEQYFAPSTTTVATASTTQGSGTATSTIETTSTTTVQTSTTTPSQSDPGGDSGSLNIKNGYAFAPGVNGSVLGAYTAPLCLRITNRLSYYSDDSTTHGEVSDLQYFLKQNGYFNNQITGYFRNITEDAVKQYQINNNITANGIVDRETSEIMQKSCVR